MIPHRVSHLDKAQSVETEITGTSTRAQRQAARKAARKAKRKAKREAKRAEQTDEVVDTLENWPGTSTEYSNLRCNLWWDGRLVARIPVPSATQSNYEWTEFGNAEMGEKRLDRDGFFPRTPQSEWSMASEYVRLFCIDTRGMKDGKPPQIHLCQRYFDRFGVLAAQKSSTCPPPVETGCLADGSNDGEFFCSKNDPQMFFGCPAGIAAMQSCASGSVCREGQQAVFDSVVPRAKTTVTCVPSMESFDLTPTTSYSVRTSQPSRFSTRPSPRG
jgi:hypothetical protein